MEKINIFMIIVHLFSIHCLYIVKMLSSIHYSCVRISSKC